MSVSPHHFIAGTHFNKRTRTKLAKKGIIIVGAVALPVEGSFLNTETGYNLDDNGTHRVRTFLEVLKLAA